MTTIKEFKSLVKDEEGLGGTFHIVKNTEKILDDKLSLEECTFFENFQEVIKLEFEASIQVKPKYNIEFQVIVNNNSYKYPITATLAKIRQDLNITGMKFRKEGENVSFGILSEKTITVESLINPGSTSLVLNIE